MTPRPRPKTRTRLAWIAAIVAASAAAAAEEHVVLPGETPAQIAHLYYGDDPSGLVVLANANGLGDADADSIVPGQRLIVPVPRHLAVQAGDTWASLAEKTLGDRSRAGALARTNRADADVAPELGVEIVVPIVLTHHPDGRDSLATITKRFYGGMRGGLKLLRDYNDLRLGRPAADKPILVPFPDLRISPSGEEALSHTRAAQTDGVRAQAQAEIAAALPPLDELWRAGEYTELVAAASRLLGRPEATGNQQVTLNRLLAYAYVALDREDLALAAFREALSHQPDLDLNPITTSPKILRVLREARRTPPAPRPTP